MDKSIENRNLEELAERARRTARLDSQRARRYRGRKRAAGEMRLTMYVPKEAADFVRAAMREALDRWNGTNVVGLGLPANDYDRSEVETRNNPETLKSSFNGAPQFLRVDFVRPDDVAEVRKELREQGFLFLPEHDGWCGRADPVRITSLVSPCHGRATPLSPDSAMVRAWERYSQI